MPVIKNKGKHSYNINVLSKIFKDLIIIANAKNEDIIVYLEKAAARPVSGKRACFMTGYGYGLIQGIFNALDIKYVLITPQSWMLSLNLMSKGKEKKKRSINWCRKNYPRWDWKRTNACKKFHDGLTDACCIAYVGYLREKTKYEIK